MPLIDDILQNLHNAKVFSKLDLKNGFFHIDIDENSIQYTAFITPEGHYEFLKVPLAYVNHYQYFNDQLYF